MRTKLLLWIFALFAVCALQAKEVNDRYIEVTGTSEIEIVPDKIHYLIEIREYFEEEFDGKSKPEGYRTKVPLEQIEQQLWKVLADVGILKEAVRTQEVGDYWRRQGQDFLVSGYVGLSSERENRGPESCTTEGCLSGGGAGKETGGGNSYCRGWQCRNVLVFQCTE